MPKVSEQNPPGGFLKGSKEHPRNVHVEVRPHRHYRPPDWEDGSHSPGSTLWVSEAELQVAHGQLIRIDSEEYRKMQKNRGKPGSQHRAHGKG